MLFSVLILFGSITSAVALPPSYDARPYERAVRARQLSYNATGLEVDLGYSTYQGVANSSTNINVFRGIRFAAPPIGKNRWQAPQVPDVNRSSTLSASSYGPICPQNSDALSSIHATSETGASEDCLFLNVYSPNNVTGPLPVLVWIHGGGYGAGNGRQDLSTIINTNGNSFVGVSIQYRLGAFGFLSSDELFRNGVVNAGLLDQHFALQWVQQYIDLFGGDRSKVTIAGESAGGGSVMLQDMAYGGSLGEQLFINTISASPYLPMQYGYKDWVPSQSYYAFASAVGCSPMNPYGANGSTTIFSCLQQQDSATLINASALISQSGTYGTWAFLPVTDGVFIQDLPSRQLLRRKVNGLNVLVGNNANEGAPFTPQNIVTEDDLVAWLRLTFPLFSNNDIAKILLYYPSSNASTNPNAPEFATTGDSGPTALNESSVGTGQQQRADNIYAETTFVCPCYWQTEAYSDNKLGGKAYKYQYSVPPALHGNDVAGYFGKIGNPPFTADFSIAFQRVWGNFITNSDPSISNMVANGVSTNDSSSNPASSWPPFSVYAPYQIDLNETATVLNHSSFNTATSSFNVTSSATQLSRNNFTLVNAYTWEGGRGMRCDFWRSMGEIVPE